MNPNSIMYVTKDLFESEVGHLHAKLDAIHDEVKKTRGAVQQHEVSIARIWTIGSTAWALVAAGFGALWATK